MRILVDITREDIETLDRIAVSTSQSRAAVIRAAVKNYLHTADDEATPNAFGLWSAGEIDGLQYQEKMRSEW